MNSLTHAWLRARLLPGLVLLLCAGAALFWWAVLQPAQASVEQARLRAARVQGQLSQRAVEPKHGRALPPESAFPDVIGELARVAQDAGLAFDEGSYQVARLAQGKVVRYEITLPLHGGYPQLRAFLAGAAGGSRTLVIDNFQLQRHKVDDAALDARVHLAMLMQARP